MGIDYDSRLIVGWKVDREKTCSFLEKHNVGTCYDEEQCFCGPHYCWKNWDSCPVPENFTFVECSPYFDCPLDDRNVYLTLAFSEPIAIEILAQPYNWEGARQLAMELGAEEDEEAVFAVPHIW